MTDPKKPGSKQQGQQQPSRGERLVEHQFKPGQSGNPGGRPKLPDWLAERSVAALQHIADVADGTEPAEPELRLKAAQIIVERYFGKAAANVAIEGTLGIEPVGEMRITIVRPQDRPAE